MSQPPVILVTGASRGLGRGIALELAMNGFSVAVNYAGNVAAANETCRRCAELGDAAGQEFLPIQADISMADDRNRMVDTVVAEFGRIDGLVNNAGIAPRVRADVAEATEESFELLMRTNLMGPYFLTQRVVNHWLNGVSAPLIPGGFKVVFITSISAHTASITRGDYCISKAGLAMATQLWAQRTAAEGIQVYECRPGIMKTDMTNAVTDKYDALIAEGLVPQKRWGTPEDLGKAVAALVRGDFPFSTGAVIDVDGGFRIRHL